MGSSARSEHVHATGVTLSRSASHLPIPLHPHKFNFQVFIFCPLWSCVSSLHEEEKEMFPLPFDNFNIILIKCVNLLLMIIIVTNDNMRITFKILELRPLINWKKIRFYFDNFRLVHINKLQIVIYDKKITFD